MTDKRREERVAVALPIFLADATGITRDVSASGIFFEINTRFAVGDPVNFARRQKIAEVRGQHRSHGAA